MAKGPCHCERRDSSTLLLLSRKKQELNLFGLVTLLICKENACHVTKLVVPRHIFQDLTKEQPEAPKQTAPKDL